MGNEVTMHYVPSSTLSECTATQFQWMNGNTVVATTAVPTWSTDVNGAYWVCAHHIVTGKQIGRASCRERV